MKKTGFAHNSKVLCIVAPCMGCVWANFGSSLVVWSLFGMGLLIKWWQKRVLDHGQRELGVLGVWLGVGACTVMSWASQVDLIMKNPMLGLLVVNHLTLFMFLVGLWGGLQFEWMWDDAPQVTQLMERIMMTVLPFSGFVFLSWFLFTWTDSRVETLPIVLSICGMYVYAVLGLPLNQSVVIYDHKDNGRRNPRDCLIRSGHELWFVMVNLLVVFPCAGLYLVHEEMDSKRFLGSCLFSGVVGPSFMIYVFQDRLKHVLNSSNTMVFTMAKTFLLLLGIPTMECLLFPTSQVMEKMLVAMMFQFGLMLFWAFLCNHDKLSISSDQFYETLGWALFAACTNNQHNLPFLVSTQILSMRTQKTNAILYCLVMATQVSWTVLFVNILYLVRNYYSCKNNNNNNNSMVSILGMAMLGGKLCTLMVLPRSSSPSMADVAIHWLVSSLGGFIYLYFARKIVCNQRFFGCHQLMHCTVSYFWFHVSCAMKGEQNVLFAMLTSAFLVSPQYIMTSATFIVVYLSQIPIFVGLFIHCCNSTLSPSAWIVFLFMLVNGNLMKQQAFTVAMGLVYFLFNNDLLTAIMAILLTLPSCHHHLCTSRTNAVIDDNNIKFVNEIL